MGLYRKPNTACWYCDYLEPVRNPESGHIERRQHRDGRMVPVVRKVNRSTGETMKSRAKAVYDLWAGAARKAIEHPELADEQAMLQRRKQEEARARIAAAEAKAKRLTVDGLRALWLRHAAPKRSLSTDKQRWDVLVEILGADRAVEDLTPDDAISLRDALMERKTRTGGKHRPGTINKYMTLLGAALKVAEDHGTAHKAPLRRWKPMPEENERDRIATPEEYARLLKTAHGELRTVIVVAFGAGMRRGEIAALRWKQIDLKAKRIKLHSSETKTAQGRIVPLSQEVADELEKMPRRIDGKVFGMNGPWMSMSFSRLTRALEIEDLRLHDARHSFATRLRRAGVDITTIMKIMGHRSLTMYRRYQTVDDEDLYEAIGKLEAARAKPLRAKRDAK